MQLSHKTNHLQACRVWFWAITAGDKVVCEIDTIQSLVL